MTSLGTPGGDYSFGASISDDGQVVGEAAIRTAESHAFHWLDGALTDLGALTGRSSTADAINASGQIIGGWSRAEGDAPDRAVIWESHQAIDLGTQLGTQEGTWAVAL